MIKVVLRSEDNQGEPRRNKKQIDKLFSNECDGCHDGQPGPRILSSTPIILLSQSTKDARDW